MFDTAANPNTTPANEELMREDAIDNSNLSHDQSLKDIIANIQGEYINFKNHLIMEVRRDEVLEDG
jgi:hypothetical protein